MRKLLFVLTLTLVFSFSQSVLALLVHTTHFKEGSEPDGFRGIKWGKKPSNKYGLVEVEAEDLDGHLKTYERKGEKKSIADADIVSIQYEFFKNKFCAARVKSHGEANWHALRSAMWERFGKNEASYFRDRQLNQTPDYYEWVGKETEITLRYAPEVSDYIGLDITSTKIDAKRQEYQRLRQNDL